ncbi:MAG: hypothetical protein H0T43_11830 [Solirubrobacterales bacterium]|nr:hypothetical protein [Solirubrobacterales bacterium]
MTGSERVNVTHPPYVAVVGGGEASADVLWDAEAVGAGLAAVDPADAVARALR